jgi:hypothetical protein
MEEDMQEDVLFDQRDESADLAGEPRQERAG